MLELKELKLKELEDAVNFLDVMEVKDLLEDEIEVPVLLLDLPEFWSNDKVDAIEEKLLLLLRPNDAIRLATAKAVMIWFDLIWFD